MRQVKFRAFDSLNNKMVFIGNMRWSPGGEYLDARDDWYIDGYWVPGNKYDDIMQFTGLHDKNGKPIYEHDILKHSDGYAREVGTLEQVFHLVGESCWDGDTAEIIGNLYETPHLLTNHIHEV